MTRIAIDAMVLVELARRGVQPPDHQLVGPAGLRSAALALFYRDARAEQLDSRAVRETVASITTLRVRLLGDRVSRATAWQLADTLRLNDTVLAEYLAVAVLQADELIALDPELRAIADGVVPLGRPESLLPATGAIRPRPHPSRGHS